MSVLPTTNGANRLPGTGGERFQGEIDLPVIQQAIQHLRQELEFQKISIAQTRRQLPRGWYRQSSPTVDLEILMNVVPSTKLVRLPNIWPSSLAQSNNR